MSKATELLPTDAEVEKWFEENVPLGASPSSTVYKFRLWLRDRLASQEKEGWISVDDRLPGKSGLVLIVVEATNDIYISHYKHNRNCFEVWGAGRDPVSDMKTTHWRPLPEAPKPEKGDADAS